MTAIDRRIRMCLLAEKMERQKSCSERLGLEDVSVFHGKQVKYRAKEQTGGNVCKGD